MWGHLKRCVYKLLNKRAFEVSSYISTHLSIYMFWQDILCGIQKGVFENPYKISYPYTKLKYQAILSWRANRSFWNCLQLPFVSINTLRLRQMAGILQMTFSFAFSCMKIMVDWFKLKFVPKGPMKNKSVLIQMITGCWTGNKPLVYVALSQCVNEKGTSKRMSAPIFFMSISSEERAFSGVVRLRLWHHFWSCDFPLHAWSQFWSHDFLVTALLRMAKSSKVVSPEVMLS